MKKYTREQLIHYLKEASTALRKAPTCKDFDSASRYPSSKTYVSRFGSWNSALATAGLSPNVKVYGREELVESIRQLAKELGRPPKSSDLAPDWCASYSTYRKHFSTWKNALHAAGISRKQPVSLKAFISKRAKL